MEISEQKIEIEKNLEKIESISFACESSEIADPQAFTEIIKTVEQIKKSMKENP